jgi:Domain of unknown function (DUF4328)
VTYSYGPPVHHPAVRRLRRPAIRATVALGLVCAAAIAQWVGALILLGVDPESYDADQETIGLLSIVWGLFYLFAGIEFIGWLRTAHAGIRELGTELRWTRGWTIGAWFIPLASLVIPLLMISEMDRAAEERVAAGTRRLGRWVFVLWAILWTARQVFLDPSVFMEDAATGVVEIVLGAGLLIDLAAAAFAVLLIWRMTANIRTSSELAGPYGTAPVAWDPSTPYAHYQQPPADIPRYVPPPTDMPPVVPPPADPTSAPDPWSPSVPRPRPPADDQI